MSLQRTIRPYLTIDGDAVVELDYKTLHPILLYYRNGIALNFDPYVITEHYSQAMRDLGKRTFNRLLNRLESNPAKRLTIRAAKGDLDILHRRMTFKQYVAMLSHRLANIHQWLGTGVGLELQREDSDLALSVMRTMENAGIVVLPVHDSFIVAERHEDILEQAMADAFVSQYGFMPEIKAKRSRPFSGGFPPVHN